MKVLLTNLTTNSLSLDLNLGEDKVIRESLASGTSFDVGDVVTADDLNRSSQVRALVAAGTLSVSTQSEASDLESLLDSQLMEAVQPVAASTAVTLLGTADMSGVVQVEAQVGAVPAAGESMVLDVLKNGVSILITPITIDNATVTAVRQQLFGDEGGATVAKGDEISYSLTYVAGGLPTPIVNAALRIKLLKA